MSILRSLVSQIKVGLQRNTLQLHKSNGYSHPNGMGSSASSEIQRRFQRKYSLQWVLSAKCDWQWKSTSQTNQKCNMAQIWVKANRQILLFRKVAKLEEGSQGAAVTKWVDEFFFAVAKIITSRIEDSKYTPFWLAKNFVGWENDLQSWNPCFLGVRSPVWLFEVRRGPCLICHQHHHFTKGRVCLSPVSFLFWRK